MTEKKRTNPFAIIWKFVGSSNCWFLVFVAFALWAQFLSPDDAIVNGYNVLVMIGLVAIWHLSRIAAALEKKHD